MVPGGTITNQHALPERFAAQGQQRSLYWAAYGLGQGNQVQNWQGRITMYTDGSGGPYSRVLNYANAQCMSAP
eukprot:8401245-Karenia_brevis.AAC.1